MAIQFNTTEFEFAHGKKPRGYGSWAFNFGRGAEFIPGSMTFGEARKAAVKIARERGVDVVEVCS
jgi:hypothetical protein